MSELGMHERSHIFITVKDTSETQDFVAVLRTCTMMRSKVCFISELVMIQTGEEVN